MKSARSSHRRHAAGLVSLSVASAIIGWTAGAALAASDTSAHKNFTVAGVNYHNESFLANGPELASSSIWRSGNAPTGYLGAKARVYFASGNLCVATVWGYSTFPDSDYGKEYTGGQCGGYVYSQGRTAAFNGNDYVEQNTNRTVNLLGG